MLSTERVKRCLAKMKRNLLGAPEANSGMLDEKRLRMIGAAESSSDGLLPDLIRGDDEDVGSVVEERPDESGPDDVDNEDMQPGEESEQEGEDEDEDEDDVEDDVEDEEGDEEDTDDNDQDEEDESAEYGTCLRQSTATNTRKHMQHQTS